MGYLLVPNVYLGSLRLTWPGLPGLRRGLRLGRSEDGPTSRDARRGLEVETLSSSDLEDEYVVSRRWEERKCFPSLHSKEARTQNVL